MCIFRLKSTNSEYSSLLEKQLNRLKERDKREKRKEEIKKEIENKKEPRELNKLSKIPVSKLPKKVTSAPLPETSKVKVVHTTISANKREQMVNNQPSQIYPTNMTYTGKVFY